MTDRDLKKMNRKELLELLIALEKENNELKVRLRQQAIQIQRRTIQVKKAGNLAEAALTLNGVFESADKAAAQYLENIKLYSEQQKKIYDRIVAEAEQKAKEILENAEKESLSKIEAAETYLQMMNGKPE